MLTQLRIKNFKAWDDTGVVELAPLTILFGANSSGKSSLHQFLLMLRQTVESSDRRRVFHFGDLSTPVDLGSYAELTRNVASPLEFELAWERDEPLEVVDMRNNARLRGTSLRFTAAVGATGDAPPRVHVDDYSYALQADDGTRLVLGSRRRGAGAYEMRAEGIDLVGTPGRDGPVSPPSNFHAFPDDLLARYQKVEFAADLTLALERQLAALHYLGPLRDRPGRLYRWSGEEVSHVGWRGERTVDALLAGQGRWFDSLRQAGSESLQEVVARWLTALGVIDSFTVEPIGRGRDEYEVRVRTPDSRSEVLLTDVGFGVSQVLPVVVSCFYPGPGSTVIMEQPEIHLHPSIQSGLADLFLEAIDTREDGAPRNTQLIVESHSEHLLRRLLRRIAEERVDPDRVRCYAVNARAGGSVIERLEVDEYGNVHNWPERFFGDPADDLIAQSRSVRRRRRSVGPA